MSEIVQHDRYPGDRRLLSRYCADLSLCSSRESLLCQFLLFIAGQWSKCCSSVCTRPLHDRFKDGHVAVSLIGVSWSRSDGYEDWAWLKDGVCSSTRDRKIASTTWRFEPWHGLAWCLGLRPLQRLKLHFSCCKLLAGRRLLLVKSNRRLWLLLVHGHLSRCPSFLILYNIDHLRRRPDQVNLNGLVDNILETCNTWAWTTSSIHECPRLKSSSPSKPLLPFIVTCSNHHPGIDRQER